MLLMSLRALRLCLLLSTLTLVIPPPAAAAYVHEYNGVRLVDDGLTLTLDTGPAQRVYERDRIATRRIVAYGVTRSTGGEFSVDGVDLPIDSAMSFTVSPVPGGLRLTRSTRRADGMEVTRTVDAYAGVAGFRSQTTLRAAGPLVVTGYRLDEMRVGAVTPTLHAFRAGADWRYESDWDPPNLGDDHRGNWRSTVSGSAGEPLQGTGEWLELAYPDGGHAALVMQRHDYASSEGRYDGASASSMVNLARDVIYLGPLESDGHIENPEPSVPTGRARVIPALQSWATEPVWTVFGRDEDETAANFNALLRAESGAFRRRVIFNTNGVDSNRISTGAKDDVDFETFKALVRASREAGIDTFVLDDGWQAISGDWCPDSPQCPEPRHDRDPVKFGPRFPDDRFDAVRAFLKDDPETPEDDADLDLGLWMTPMEFHPSSKAFTTNPQWACLPIGAGTAGLSIAQPDSSSSEAGMGVWNPLAWGVNPENPSQAMRLIDWIESRIARAITVYGASYFKFDFLAWFDCGGVQPVDQYQYREAFLQMLDRLRANYPHVLLTIDETNDYRMFPYESVARGATWFENGSPSVKQQLHNVWNLAPFVPGYSLGQATAGGSEVGSVAMDALMAAGVTSHLTIWRDLRNYTQAQREAMKTWTDWYRANADSVSTMTYPLLEDPLSGHWTALQPWDAATRSGWVLAYRQADLRESVSVPVRALGNAPLDEPFALTAVDPATGVETSLGTVTAGDLRAGALTVTAGANGYSFIRIRPAS